MLRPSMLVLALAACAPKGPPKHATPNPEAVWLEVNPSTPGVCIPFLGEPDADTLASWTASIGALEARDIEVARATLPAESTHPAHHALLGVQSMLSGDPQQAAVLLDALLATHSNDPCLLATSATAQQLLGRAEEASTRIALARSIDPDDPEIALLFAFLAPQEQVDAAFTALEKGALERPERRAFAVALGFAAISRGDATEATRWLKQAYDQGEEAMGPMLLQSYRSAEIPGEYLRLASQMGMPLGDDGLLATAEDPVASFHALVGLGADESLVATLRTDHGDLTCVLFADRTPITVANFVGLATGTQPWAHPETGPGSGPLYADLLFHRTIPGFMVQTGDPIADGTGGPGYSFPDELDPTLLFDRPGRLAMANSGPDTNGSQFFVTEAPTAHLDGRHTIFGQCAEDSVAKVKAIAGTAEPARLEGIHVASVATASLPILPDAPSPPEADPQPAPSGEE